jgi:hypothetical protein
MDAEFGFGRLDLGAEGGCEMWSLRAALMKLSASAMARNECRCFISIAVSGFSGSDSVFVGAGVSAVGGGLISSSAIV